MAEAYANAPKAAQQMSNYSGATAGQETQNMNNMAGQLQGGSAQANQLYQNQLAAQQNVLGGANTIVNNQTSGYSNLLQGANQQYANAANVMSSAGKTMASIENLQQHQGYITAEQVATYQNAYSQYIQSKAAAAASYAAANASNAQAAQTNQQVQYMQNALNSFKQLYGNNWQAAVAELSRGQPVTVPQASAPGGGLAVASFNNPGGLSLQGGNSNGLQGYGSSNMYGGLQ